MLLEGCITCFRIIHLALHCPFQILQVFQWEGKNYVLPAVGVAGAVGGEKVVGNV